MSVKKLVLIICAVLIGVVTALLGVYFVLENANLAVSAPLSSDSSVISSDSEISSVESVPVIVDNGIRLRMSSPQSKSFTVTENSVTFTGTSDPDEALTLNGNPVTRNTDGSFSFTATLNIGKNTFSFVHKGETHTYSVRYRYVVINSYTPSTNQIYSSGSTFGVSVTARNGSTVTARFNGQTIALNPTVQSDDPFISYSGSFSLPGDNYADLNLGKVTYSATYNGITESFNSGNVTCKRPDFIVNYDPNATPLGGRYVNVGSGIIAEIVGYEAETFAPRSTNDHSMPTNNYLPKGTVDYCSPESFYYNGGSEKKEYALLRYGRQVYVSRIDKPRKTVTTIVKKSAGTLPDHNEIGIASLENGGQHTTLTLDTTWKAPFYLDILPQQYTNPNKPDYTISSPTYNYIDITFCYATVLNGEITIPEDNPLFSSAKIIQNQSDHTLRLYLKKQGGFHGWDAHYNKQGQLVFEFLNPAKITTAENEYGVDLTGVEILIDVGHGGIDPGALGRDSKNHNEAIQNLYLANKLSAELKSIGATVYLTRTTNATSSSDDKIKLLKSLKPDICIAIHHNSGGSSANGFDSYYYYPFAKKAAEFVYMHTNNTGIYKKSKLGWHYYFVARTSVCPVVLTENGYISNLFDYNNIINEQKNITKAKAITKGVTEYFKYLQ